MVRGQSGPSGLLAASHVVEGYMSEVGSASVNKLVDIPARGRRGRKQRAIQYHVQVGGRILLMSIYNLVQ